MRAALCALCLALLVSSCGYRFGRGELSESYRTICIPYVEGDDQGIFTTALIRAFSQRGGLVYQSGRADLILEVCLFEPIDENIGFIYAPDSNIVVSNEARLTLTAKISLIEAATGCPLIPSFEVTQSLDFDFEPDLGNVNFHDFSLGQLEMHNLAEDAAFPPLFRILAEKIVDYVNYSW